MTEPVSKRSPTPKTEKRVRCAIYTRKSTEEGLAQEFNSLDAQREAAEAFIRSQSGEGWECLPAHFDDGGFSGGTMERPALNQLLTAIDAGQIDCVVVYKVDRLSRSLLDFARMMQRFDAKQVSFVSVTQQFNTTHSMGRLTLNILLSFAQFEREIIAERTRDKIAATRRKGKWTGGVPILGYTLNPQRKLIIEPEEAERVRAIFSLYGELGSLLPTVQELARRNWTTKRWATKSGRMIGGLPFSRTNLYYLLTNVLYVGRVRYRAETHPGEHEAVVSPELWQQVQDQLSRNGQGGGRDVRNRFGAILKGLLRCEACAAAMTPSHTTKHGQTRYRYYVCSAAQKHGRSSCPSPSISAPAVECLVIQQLREHPTGSRLPEGWDRLSTRAQTLALAERIETVGFDGRSGELQIQLRAFASPDSLSLANPTTLASRVITTPDPVLTGRSA